MIGRTVGRYRIVAKLGQGGMGSVWKAHDTHLDRVVALKFLPESFAGSAAAKRRFLREARAASVLDHPGVATVFDAGEAEGSSYIAVAFVDGETVSDLASRGPLPVDEAIRITVAAGDALAHAHARRIVHRDVTGRNIMVARDGRVVVLDFGLALPEGASRLTSTGVALGTVAYMAPEVAQGRVADQRSDVYGLGVVLFEMLTGTLPFVRERPEALLYATIHEPPEPPGARRGGVSADLNRIVLKAMAKDPWHRYHAMKEFLADLAKLSGGVKDQPRPLYAELGAIERRAPAPSRIADRPTEPLSTAQCLAVLPFQSLGAGEGHNAQAEVFAHGLAETVSASLAKRSAIQVVPPSAAPPGTLLDEDLRRVGRNLGADLILRGTVQKSGGQMRVTYSLLQADRCIQAAGDTVDGSVEDLFALEDRLVASVIRSLNLNAAVPRRASPPEQRDRAAYEHYLQALGYLQRFEDAASVDGAIGILERLLESEGASATVQAALGRAYLHKYKLTRERGWEDRAAASCARALDLDPNSPDVLVTLGHLHTSLGRPIDAVHDFQQALKLRHNNPDALLGLSEAYEAAGKLREAEGSCREAIALRPKYWGGYNRLGILYSGQGRYERAAESWTRVVELTPDNVRGWNNLGAAFFEMGRYQEALAAYHRSIEILPSAAAYSSLGTVHFFLGNYNEAAAMFEKGAALRPSDPRMWGNLGDAYRWTPGLEDRAAETFDRAIALEHELLRVNTKDAEGWADLAGWLAKRVRSREARRAIQRALKLNSNDVGHMAMAGRVYHLAGDRGKALEWLEHAVERGYSREELLRDPELAALRSVPEFQRLVKEGSTDVTGT